MKFCIEKMCSCIGDLSSRLYDPDRVFRCDFDVARVGEGEIITRLRVCKLLSPIFGLPSVAKLIPVHKYTILVTVHISRQHRRRVNIQDYI